ncbi:hypothetical protein GQ43DRAFT_288949 [Delitschia confertaspora ATCC 74209]|uniref:Uncharacterized protein n=1 Tax=Delitschia confertaspora ATCC 74209 TaxID=1513339 RepID=A0A9P4JAJ5_9PLEO|nr:hypothetical protein GQ43DRAFT_288949 [Delitschia confertaspora ATCC 74209]
MERITMFQNEGPLNGTNSPESPAGGILLASPSNRPYLRSPLAEPFSPSHSYFGSRRLGHGSTLLGSPARGGHASRMRQLFEEARAENTIASSKLLDGRHGVSLDSGCYSNRLFQNTRQHSRGFPSLFDPYGSTTPPRRPRDIIDLAPKPSNPSGDVSHGIDAHHSSASEAWSGDSEYLTTELPPRTRSPSTLAAEPRINDWLASVPASPISDVEYDQSLDEGSMTPLRRWPNNKSSQPTSFLLPKQSPYSVPHPSPVTPAEGYTDDKVCINVGQQQLHTSGSMAQMRGGIALSVQSTPVKKPKSTESLKSSTSSNLSKSFNSTRQWRLHHYREVERRAAIHPGENGDDFFTFSPVASMTTPTRRPHHRPVDDDDGVQLSPLSPNVCIGRGHHRCHSTRSGRILHTLACTGGLTNIGNRLPPTRADDGTFVEEPITPESPGGVPLDDAFCPAEELFR